MDLPPARLRAAVARALRAWFAENGAWPDSAELIQALAEQGYTVAPGVLAVIMADLERAGALPSAAPGGAGPGNGRAGLTSALDSQERSLGWHD